MKPIETPTPLSGHAGPGWRRIATAPFDRDLELAVIDQRGTHILAFACRRILGGWLDASRSQRLTGFEPTHWREWRPETAA